MEAVKIINEIQRLPIAQRIYIVEKTMSLLRKQEESNSMSIAAEALLNDYTADKELTAFTNLDFGDLDNNIMNEIRQGLSKVLSI